MPSIVKPSYQILSAVIIDQHVLLCLSHSRVNSSQGLRLEVGIVIWATTVDVFNVCRQLRDLVNWAKCPTGGTALAVVDLPLKVTIYRMRLICFLAIVSSSTVKVAVRGDSTTSIVGILFILLFAESH